jgi:DNA polymerase-1
MFFDDETEIKKNGHTLLLIDWNNLLWKSFHAHSTLLFAGHSTASLYGVVTQLAKHISGFKPSNIIVCNDSPPYIRRESYNNFKDNRTKLDPDVHSEFTRSRTDCESFLGLLNIPLIGSPGLEADDIIASFVRDYTNQFDKIVILSNDDDLFQLLTYPNVVIQRSKVLYGIKEFTEEHSPLSIQDWGKLTALAGSHNNLPGLPGIGPVKGKKILTSGKWEEVYNQNKETLDLFLKLIKIPFTDDFISPPLVKHSSNERQILKFLVRFGIKLTQNMCDSFALLN